MGRDSRTTFPGHSLVLSGIGTGAPAAQPPEKNPDLPEEIVVTAQKREEKLQDMPRRRLRNQTLIVGVGLTCVAALVQSSHAQTQADADPPGTIAVPAYKLPPSVYLSETARKQLEAGLDTRFASLDQEMAHGGVAAVRAAMTREMAPMISALQARYGVRVQETRVGGIHGYWVRPARRAARSSGRVLLDLPAGGFTVGQANPIGLVEAIPIAGIGGFDILTIDYRQAPEATFPSASEDVALVYRALLKSHRPKDIGIYGCSTGGLLTAQSLAWFQTHGLPRPGAAGILCASADGRWAGDSWYWQNPLQGSNAAPSLDEDAYYGNHDLSDPLLSPVFSDEILSRFPPTLLISATRASELSAAVNTHRLLVRNGVHAELNVWDGLGHAFLSNPDLPESKEAYRVIVSFFKRQLAWPQ